ncbi:MAG: S8 family serine peptidase, partial [Pseudomonadales bacterium]|nr:S8 family serine peptidase [Pseudomonadales bacterium]
WIERNDSGGSGSGYVRLTSSDCPADYNYSCLELRANGPSNVSVERSMELMGVHDAFMFFDYSVSNVTSTAEFVIEASADGVNWSQPLARYSKGGTGKAGYSTAVNITPYVSTNTVIRFRVTDSDPTAKFKVDNIGVWFRAGTYARDDFDSLNYSGSSWGNESWAGSWSEVGDGNGAPNAGNIRIQNNAACPDPASPCLGIAASTANASISRGIDLTNTFAAELRLDGRIVSSSPAGEIVLEATADGSTWTQLDRYSAARPVMDVHYDLNRFRTANARLRFRVTQAAPGTALYLDGLEVSVERNQRDDSLGHGTHIAGIIGGNGGSTGLYPGVARGARIYDVRVLDNRGHGSAADLLAGLDWIVSNGAANGIKVVNLSLGSGVFESSSTDPLVLAVERLWDAGMVVVASAGNSGQYGNMTITSPGTSRKVITVGSLTDSG